MRTHTDTRVPTACTHTQSLTQTHTPAERTPRDSTTNLILCWHTISQLCHAFAALSLSFNHDGVCLPDSVSRRVSSHRARGVCVCVCLCVCVCVCVCVLCACSTSVLQTTASHRLSTFKQTAGLCRSSGRVGLWSSELFSLSWVISGAWQEGGQHRLLLGGHQAARGPPEMSLIMGFSQQLRWIWNCRISKGS